jgi:hypothetical protein
VIYIIDILFIKFVVNYSLNYVLKIITEQLVILALIGSVNRYEGYQVLLVMFLFTFAAMKARNKREFYHDW